MHREGHFVNGNIKEGREKKKKSEEEKMRFLSRGRGGGGEGLFFSSYNQEGWFPSPFFVSWVFILSV